MTNIKMCGITRLEDIEQSNIIEPEFVGFVFWEKSSRNVSKENAEKLKAMLSPKIKAVGVFVDEDQGKIAALLTEGIIDMAQLHGAEDEEYIGRLRQLTDKPIIKAFIIKEKADIERASKSSADFLLLDSGKGTGRTFNWKLIEEADIPKPFFLAGGLDAQNVSRAVEQLRPYAVDVSSGIESEGKKDPVKMREFADIVRSIR